MSEFKNTDYKIGIELEAEFDQSSVSVGNTAGIPVCEELAKSLGRRYLKAGESFSHAIAKEIPKFVDLYGILYHQGFDGGGIEYAFKPFDYQGIQKMKPKIAELMYYLIKFGYVPTKSGTAGIHVHIDRKAYTVESFLTLVHLCSNLTNFIQRFVGRALRTCDFVSFIPLPKESKELLWVKGKACVSGDSHAGIINSSTIRINSNGEGTFEFRWFNSTLNINRFYSFVELIVAITDFSNANSSLYQEPNIHTAFWKFIQDNFHQYPHFSRWAEAGELVTEPKLQLA